MKKKKNIVIPVSYEVCGYVVIVADSVEDAVRAIEKDEDIVEKMPCLNSPEYVDGSYQIETDPDLIRMYTEMFDNRELSDVTFTDIVM